MSEIPTGHDFMDAEDFTKRRGRVSGRTDERFDLAYSTANPPMIAQ